MSVVLEQAGLGIRNPRKKSRFLPKLMKQRFLFLLLMPGMIYFLVFKYGPMYGILIAFKDYSPQDGVFSSPWVGFKYFREMFEMKYFWTVTANTLKISILKIAIGFPAPIIFALLLNEIVSNKFRRIVQTISYLPHFLSWVIVAGLIFQLVSPSYGVYGLICEAFGWQPRVLLGNGESFLQILIVSNVWKEIGYGSIIYLAAIAGINSDMYESAVIDGAGRFKQCLYITIPSILPTICMLFVLGLGGILDGGFDQIFNLYNSMVMPTADIIDTFVYRVGLVDMQYSFSIAVGIAKSVIALVLVLSSNWIVGKLSNYTVF
ncbi:ABC transporter permease [Paenibacillus glycinis]|uniref:ABC transporter permease subunit n=1 Tax=Paenibacillus glycinis TaxID=2697035 RepID=A0ABW9XXL5_9BACL|nr:ABC transporter permease subunit [Paenibacillus glycinis]NBD27014.1 ABC transporter permease subunit [Paenibacillus glycinis]